MASKKIAELRKQLADLEDDYDELAASINLGNLRKREEVLLSRIKTLGGDRRDDPSALLQELETVQAILPNKEEVLLSRIKTLDPSDDASDLVQELETVQAMREMKDKIDMVRGAIVLRKEKEETKRRRKGLMGHYPQKLTHWRQKLMNQLKRRHLSNYDLKIMQNALNMYTKLGGEITPEIQEKIDSFEERVEKGIILPKEKPPTDAELQIEKLQKLLESGDTSEWNKKMVNITIDKIREYDDIVPSDLLQKKEELWPPREETPSEQIEQKEEPRQKMMEKRMSKKRLEKENQIRKLLLYTTKLPYLTISAKEWEKNTKKIENLMKNFSTSAQDITDLRKKLDNQIDARKKYLKKHEKIKQQKHRQIVNNNTIKQWQKLYDKEIKKFKESSNKNDTARINRIKQLSRRLEEHGVPIKLPGNLDIAQYRANLKDMNDYIAERTYLLQNRPQATRRIEGLNEKIAGLAKKVQKRRQEEIVHEYSKLAALDETPEIEQQMEALLHEADELLPAGFPITMPDKPTYQTIREIREQWKEPPLPPLGPNEAEYVPGDPLIVRKPLLSRIRDIPVISKISKIMGIILCFLNFILVPPMKNKIFSAMAYVIIGLVLIPVSPLLLIPTLLMAAFHFFIQNRVSSKNKTIIDVSVSILIALIAGMLSPWL